MSFYPRPPARSDEKYSVSPDIENDGKISPPLVEIVPSPTSCIGAGTDCARRPFPVSVTIATLRMAERVGAVRIRMDILRQDGRLTTESLAQ